jgi:arsenate reductase-like glutaredoxin family protein
VDARKQRYTADDLAALLGEATRVVALKGKQRIELDLKKDRPSGATLAAALLGPTGNLRAPTLRCGKTVVVGFGEEAYEELFA